MRNRPQRAPQRPTAVAVDAGLRRPVRKGLGKNKFASDSPPGRRAPRADLLSTAIGNGPKGRIPARIPTVAVDACLRRHARKSIGNKNASDSPPRRRAPRADLLSTANEYGPKGRMPANGQTAPTQITPNPHPTQITTHAATTGPPSSGKTGPGAVSAWAWALPGSGGPRRPRPA